MLTNLVYPFTNAPRIEDISNKFGSINLFEEMDNFFIFELIRQRINNNIHIYKILLIYLYY